MADDKGGSPAKVGRSFVKLLQSKKYAYDYEHYMGISTRDQSPGRSSERLRNEYSTSTSTSSSLFVDDLRDDDQVVTQVVTGRKSTNRHGCRLQ